ncbi:uncharacterized protein PV09_02928 [Verruconis gallopava]|uniref:Large ribosomal subunit protein bL28m n=1 Tax=Verruconis gallopava TaxID=253628 RepID=A0A0D1Z0K9_9PEZI|nr:uncharacterized protein PV09_02928 [Verruconis gallopava]KIW06492.1 hypothetical protein PV09_02928 [Verruconis gallopava]
MASLLRPRRPIHQEVHLLSQQIRSFSFTHRQCGHKQALAHAHANLPEYPYGPSRWYKQSNFGLYGGLKISSGNNVSPETETKTRRKWRPNVQMKRLYSHALQRYVRVKVATRVLRTIDKCGGLDEYLVGEKPARIKELGMKGWELRCKVMETQWWLERKIKLREQWGLSPVRTYFPEEKEDTEGQPFMVGMYGEKLLDAAAAAEAGYTGLKEAEPEYDQDGNPISLPDLIAYDESENEDMEAAKPEEGELVDVGKIPEEPDYKYVSGKLKRKAILKERKAIAAQAKAAHRARKEAERSIEQRALAGEKGLRSTDLKQHLAYQERKAALEKANKILATTTTTTDASNSSARPTL